MSVTDAQISAALCGARDSMVLEHDNQSSAQLLRRRAELSDRHSSRRRWMVPAGVGVGVLGIGAAVAVAVTSNDGSFAAFKHLHPDKANARSTTEEGHVVLGELDSAKGERVRAYVTTQPGRGACVLVEHISQSGAQQDSVAYCGQETGDRPDLRLVNGALIGWVPDRTVASVRLNGTSYDESAQVVARHFVAAATASGDTETVTGVGASGNTVHVWTVTVS